MWKSRGGDVDINDEIGQTKEGLGTLEDPFGFCLEYKIGWVSTFYCVQKATNNSK